MFAATSVAFRYSQSSSSKTTSPKASSSISFSLLQKQNAETSSALIDHYAGSKKFDRLAGYEGQLTVTRDKEDDEKLQIGIDFAKRKGVIDKDFRPEPYVTIDVLGKTPDQVADIILKHVEDSKSGSSVIVLVGLSGTGKGTTVSNLRQKLEDQQGKKVVTWSNGNIFRSVTLLAATWCEQQNGTNVFDADKALTKENLASFMKMLSFGKFKGKYDTRIHGLGLDMLVSEVQNTALKSPVVSKNIPTVAQFTQGEVIVFAASAVETMGRDGIFVLLEGREQTVNYVRTPHRFNLVLSDDSLIGKRRAAQRLMAGALSAVSDKSADVDVQSALDSALDNMVEEINEFNSQVSSI